MRTRDEQARAMDAGIEGDDKPSERLIWLMAKELKEAERRAEQRMRAEIARLREYYEASEAINQVGILGATPEMYDRENI
ncbi:hypothetical protein FKW54_09540, partial [Acetobacter pomorum]